MRRWLRAAAGSASLVSIRPDLWLPGALGWLVGVGWLPFIAAVARPPSEASLTYLGARLVTSGAWPWNAVALGAAAVLLVLLAILAAAAADATLVAMLERRSPSAVEVARLAAVRLICLAPAIVAALVMLIALTSIARDEFVRPPEPGGAVLGTVIAIAPYIVAFAVAAGVSAALAALSGRLAIRHRDVGVALRRLPRAARRLGTAGVAHGALSLIAQAVFLALAGLLLGVLWAPIRVELRPGGQIGLAVGLLLVGFVAIWLCLVLAGGALHAWAAATWSRLLTDEARPMHEQGPETTWRS